MNGILLETDIITEYLLAEHGNIPLFRRLLQVIPCYSTFIQAAELYSTARSDAEFRILDKALFGLKILGASSRYAKTIGQVLSSQGKSSDHRTAIVAAMAIESAVPLVTDLYHKKYTQISGVRLLSGNTLRQTTTNEELDAIIQETIA